jgi:hypothetical protein
MFAVAMAIYFLIVRRWVAEAPASEPTAAPATPMPTLGVVLAVVTLAVPGAWQWLDANRAPFAAAAAYPLPAPVAGWEEQPLREEPRGAEFPNADGFESRSFSGAGNADREPVDVFRAYYLEQSQGREVAGYANHPQGPDLRLRSEVISPGGRWREIKAQSCSGDDWLVWYAYRVGERRYVDALRAQLRYGVASLSDNPLATVVVLRTRCVADCPGARTRLARFAHDAKLDQD